MRQFHSISEIRRSHNGHWFDPATMRFFRSRVGDTVYPGNYFISSEQFDWDSPRLYSIRRYNSDDDNFDTIGDFQQFKTYAQAKAAIKKLVKP